MDTSRILCRLNPETNTLDKKVAKQILNVLEGLPCSPLLDRQTRVFRWRVCVCVCVCSPIETDEATQ